MDARNVSRFSHMEIIYNNSGLIISEVSALCLIAMNDQ